MIRLEYRSIWMIGILALSLFACDTSYAQSSGSDQPDRQIRVNMDIWAHAGGLDRDLLDLYSGLVHCANAISEISGHTDRALELLHAALESGDLTEVQRGSYEQILRRIEQLEGTVEAQSERCVVDVDTLRTKLRQFRAIDSIVSESEMEETFEEVSQALNGVGFARGTLRRTWEELETLFPAIPTGS